MGAVRFAGLRLARRDTPRKKKNASKGVGAAAAAGAVAGRCGQCIHGSSDILREAAVVAAAARAVAGMHEG